MNTLKRSFSLALGKRIQVGSNSSILDVLSITIDGTEYYLSMDFEGTEYYLTL